MFERKKLYHLIEQVSRAWFNHFGNYGDRGGPSDIEAFEAWFEMIKKKYLYHTHKMSLDKHPY